jgi:SAM-dependent methyltransferase
MHLPGQEEPPLTDTDPASQTTMYDEMPYPGLSHAQTHPDRLASMAILLGLDPAPVERCRVLDIGCALGVNLMAMAELLPESDFVGIDYAARQIEIGRDYLAELGLKNVRLEHMDVMAVPESLGHFDYIIAHGFYSWVPPTAQDQLLAVIRRHLAPNGVAYVSYNTYPGWYLMQVIRDSMMLRTRQMSDPAERAAAGREIVDFLAQAIPDNSGPFAKFLHSYRRSQATRDSRGAAADALLLHDMMSDLNEPVYFEQFVAHAEGHGLQYLSEVDLAAVMPSRMKPEIAHELAELTRDPMESEQWLDFMRFRTFRQTLLVHREVEVQKTLRPQVVGRFKLASLAEAKNDPVDLSPGVVEQFRTEDNASFATDHPLTKAAFVEMISNRPRAIPFEVLVRAAAARIDLFLDESTTREIAVFAANVLRALSYSPELVELHLFQPPISIVPGPRPRTTDLMRWQARMGLPATNLRHERVDLDPELRALTMLLDGERDRDQLLSAFMLLFRQGQLQAEEQSPDAAATEEIVGEQLEQTLRFMARNGMLCA